ncbi:MAG: cytochrome P450 [Rhodoluna sp.]
MALRLIGDPIGKFYSSPDMVTFAKRTNKVSVQKSITGVLVSSNHQVCSEVLKSPNWLSRPFAERLYTGPTTYTPETIHPFLDSIIAIDGAEQRRIKKLMQPVFTPRVIDSWKETSLRIVNDLFSNVKEHGEFDFVASIANPLPLAVICEIIGVPKLYWEKCNIWGRTLAGIGLDLPKNNQELEELEATSLALTDLIGELLAIRRVKPEDDLISLLASAQTDGQKLSDKEIIASVAFTLIAGFETTMNLLSVGTLALLENPDQLALLARNQELIPNFIEEALRLSSPIQFVVRTADSPLVLADGTKAKAGQTIILNLAGANRDPAVFDKPDSFLIQRENAKKNVSFGFGAHHCIGSLLARVEAEVMWRELLRRFPDVESWKLTGTPKYRSGKLIKSLESLPMSFRVSQPSAF